MGGCQKMICVHSSIQNVPIGWFVFQFENCFRFPRFVNKMISFLKERVDTRARFAQNLARFWAGYSTADMTLRRYAKLARAYLIGFRHFCVFRMDLEHILACIQFVVAARLKTSGMETGETVQLKKSHHQRGRSRKSFESLFLRLFPSIHHEYMIKSNGVWKSIDRNLSLCRNIQTEICEFEMV